MTTKKKFLQLLQHLPLYLLFIMLLAPQIWANETIPGDVLVVFRAEPNTKVTDESLSENGSDAMRVANIAKSLDASIVEFYPSLSKLKNAIFVLLHSDTKSEKILAEELLSLPDVLSASPNYKINPMISEGQPNDPLYRKETNEWNVSQWGLEAIRAPEAWEITTGNYDTYVAVIDSGIYYGHEDIVLNFNHPDSRNFFGGLTSLPIAVDPNSYHDENGHGTHVAGIIGAYGNNGEGITGVNWQTQIISLRIAGKDGHDSKLTIGDNLMTQALNHVAEILERYPERRIVINISFGGCKSKTPEEMEKNNDPCWLALSALSETNRALICVAAGNNGLDIGLPAPKDDPNGNFKKGQYHYPSSYRNIDNMIVVANAHQSGGYSRSDEYSSNYSSTYVDIAAPGTNIYSTLSKKHNSNYDDNSKHTLINSNGNLYINMSGTSMATPFVSGAAALLLSAHPAATASEIKQALLESANGRYALDYTVHGFLDVKAALDYMDRKPVGIEINSQNFPDDKFREYISQKFDVNSDSKGYLTNSEIKAAKSIIIPNMGISSLKGIEFFSALTILDCRNNDITNLVVNNLHSLRLLNVSGCRYLRNLDCSNNSLTTLRVDGCTNLTELNCDSNSLTTLNLNDCTNLTDIFTGSQRIYGIKFTKNGSQYSVNLNIYARGNLTRISNVNSNGVAVNYDTNTGIVVFNKEPTVFSYFYDVGNDLPLMNVIMSTSGSAPSIPIDEEHFPDPNFRAYLIRYYDTDSDEMLNESEIEKITQLNIAKNSISDLSGIEYLTNMTWLTCFNNNLQTLDVSSNPALEVLNCSSNQLTSLNLNGCTSMKEIYCGNNQLSALDISTCTTLKELYCEDNELTELDVSNCTELTELACMNNHLATLDVSNCTNLTGVDCEGQTVFGLTVIETGNEEKPYQVNLDTHVSAKGLNNIVTNSITGHSNTGATLKYKVTYDVNTGIIDFNTYPSYGNVGKPEKISYKYDIAPDKTAEGYYRFIMEVSLESGVKPIIPILPPDEPIPEQIRFPDRNFRAYLLQEYDRDGDGVLSDAEIGSVRSISVNGKGISNLKGIEYFTSLTTLYCSSNSLTTLDVSACKSLQNLYCRNNHLTYLNISGCASLVRLYCNNNKLTELDVSDCGDRLRGLDCSHNNLTTLDVSNCTLLDGEFNCSYNRLSTLKLGPCLMSYLQCNNNNLAYVDTEKLAVLRMISYSNQTVSGLKTSKTDNVDYPILFNFRDCIPDEYISKIRNVKAYGNSYIDYINGDSYDEPQEISSQYNNGYVLLAKQPAVISYYCGLPVSIILDTDTKGDIVTSPKIDEISLPYAIMGKKYTAILTATGDTPITWELTEGPSGLKIDSEGNITWLPSTDGEYSFTAMAKNVVNTDTKTFTISVYGKPVITTDSLPNGIVRQDYNFKLTATSHLPVTWEAGYLPEGLSCSENGLITGKPTKTVTSKYVRVTATNAAGSVTKSLYVTVSVNPIDISITETNFPDANLRSKLKDFDTNGDGALSAEEIEAVTTIDIEGNKKWNYQEGRYETISNLSGLEMFTSLINLNCSNNSLDTLNLAPFKKLKHLECSGNKLTLLDINSCIELLYLDCSKNQLEAMDVSNCLKLEYLNCSFNKIHELNTDEHVALKYLDCSYNYIAKLSTADCLLLNTLLFNQNSLVSLNVSNCSSLIDLKCIGDHDNSFKERYINLVSIDIRNCAALQNLNCKNNSLIDLDINGCSSLISIDCSGNKIINLDVSNCKKLRYLDCNQLYITNGKCMLSLDVSGCFSLETLSCSGNQLTALNVSNSPNLTSLICNDNNLYSLDFHNCTKISELRCNNNNLTILDTSNCPQLTELNCKSNNLLQLDVSNNKKLSLLYCGNNALKTLDVSMCSELREFDCSYSTSLTTLDINGCTVLRSINCQSSGLTSLDTSMCEMLEYLNCDYSHLIQLKVGGQKTLKYLYCAQNAITNELNMNGYSELQQLICEENKITRIYLNDCKSLTWLRCYDNSLVELDTSDCSALRTLNCKNQNASGWQAMKNNDNIYQVNFLTYISKNSLKNVSDVQGYDSYYWNATYDISTGISNFPRKPTKLKYNYKIPNSNTIMNVNVTLSDSTPVSLKPTITTKEFLNGSVGTEYNFTLTATGTEPFEWSATGLPNGLNINSKTGNISGTPKTANTYSLKITAKNDAGSDVKTFTLKINPPDAIKPKITTTSLQDGKVNQFYSETARATGTEPFEWSATGLPDGLSINSKTGNISGTPKTANTYSLKITAKNNAGSDEKTLKLTIDPADLPIKPEITTSEIKFGVMKAPYEFQLEATGTPTIKWSAKGLPKGLTMSESGLISGTPTKSGTTKFTVTAKNNYGTVSEKRSIIIYEAPTILTKTIKTVTSDKNFSFTLQSKGIKPFTWKISGLPDGLTPNPEKGTISGKTKTSGVFPIEVSVSNIASSDTKIFNLTIKGVAPVIKGSLPSKKKINDKYEAVFTATGTEPITWSLDGNLPEGLEFYPDTATLSGVPLETCKNIALKLIASNDIKKVSKNLKLTITGEAPKITATSLPVGVIGKDYNYSFIVTGDAKMKVNVTGLPDNLIFNEDELTITGTPSKEGKSNITFTAENGVKKVSKKLKLNSGFAPEIITSELPTGQLKKSYNFTVNATGSKTLTWTSSSKLPKGMKFSKGKFSGTPKEEGVFNVSVSVKNSFSVASKDFTLTIVEILNDNAKKLPSENSESESKNIIEDTNTEDINEVQDVNVISNDESINSSEIIITGNSRNIEDLSTQELNALEGYTIAAILPEIRVKENSQYDFKIELNEKIQTGAKLFWFAFSDKNSEDDEIAEFYDFSGEEIQNVPDEKIITVSAWLNSGVIYKPVIAVKNN